jgi:hypothetical protein
MSRIQKSVFIPRNKQINSIYGSRKPTNHQNNRKEFKHNAKIFKKIRFFQIVFFDFKSPNIKITNGFRNRVNIEYDIKPIENVYYKTPNPSSVVFQVFGIQPTPSACGAVTAEKQRDNRKNYRKAIRKNEKVQVILRNQSNSGGFG